MAGETQICVVGNLTADPELRYTQNGLPVASFTIASTPRSFDRQANEWKDGEALFLRCSAWRQLGEHIAASLTKGMRVIAQGNLKQNSYQDKEGNNRTAIELEVTDLGPSLQFATAQVVRATQGGGQGQQQPQQPQGYAPSQGAPQQGPPQGYGAPQGAPQQGQPMQQPQGYPAPQQQAPQQQMQQPMQQQQQQPQQAPQQQMPSPQNPQWGNQTGFDQTPF